MENCKMNDGTTLYLNGCELVDSNGCTAKFSDEESARDAFCHMAAGGDAADYEWEY